MFCEKENKIVGMYTGDIPRTGKPSKLNCVYLTTTTSLGTNEKWTFTQNSDNSYYIQANNGKLIEVNGIY